jgi:hypothetical protein
MVAEVSVDTNMDGTDGVDMNKTQVVDGQRKSFAQNRLTHPGLFHCLGAKFKVPFIQV